MGSFAQFLDNAGIHIAPGLFIGIIAGGVVFVVVLVVAVVLVHRRSKRKMMEGAFDKTAFSVAALTLPRPPLPTYPSASPSFPPDREAQKRDDLVGREVRQQEQTYLQLMTDLQRPASRTGTLTLPDQAPRRPPFQPPRMMQWDPAPRSPLTAYPIVTAPLSPPPISTPAVADVKALGVAQLQRGPSVRSIDSASEYSVASAPRDPQERTYQPFTLGLAPIPASPSTPKWPLSPGGYAWPKRQRASIRQELAPEFYDKVRWKTGDDSVEPAASTPVAQAFPTSSIPVVQAFPGALRTVSSPTSPGPPLRVNVHPPAQRPLSSDSTATASTAQLFYAHASANSSSPTLPTPQPSPRPF